MATAYISEYLSVGIDAKGSQAQCAQEPSITTQTVTYTTATSSSAFNSQTSLIRITCDAKAHLSFGTAPTATTSHLQIQADTPEYFSVRPGDKVSIVAA